MPLLTFKSSNIHAPTEFFYRDSGAPLDCQVYTTLVVVHGICFHNAVFQYVIPLATSKGFRMVCLNRRDYPGTTLYTPSEIKAVAGGDAGERAAFLRERGEELAVFLDALIDALSLPGPTSDGKEGGLALMGWSMGNMFTLATIASVSSLQPQVRSRLQLYLRKLIILELPPQVFGMHGRVVPPIDQTLPPQELWPQFAKWISSYFAHGNLSTRNVENIEFNVPDLSKTSVVASLSLEELSSLMDYDAASRTDILLFKFPTVLFDQMRKALFDPETRLLWPNLDMWYLYGNASAGAMVHAAWEIEKLAKMHENLPLRILTLEDAHHLVFWDEPEKAIEAFNHCLRH